MDARIITEADQTVMVFDNSGFAFMGAGTSTKPTTPIEKAKAYGDISPWFENNSFPQDVIRDIECNELLSRGLYWMSNAIISGGLVYGKIEYDDKGNERLKPEPVPEIETWLKRTNIKRYLRESSLEFYKFWNVFSELVLDPDTRNVASITCHESAFCRLGKQHPTTGMIEKCYISANWGSGTMPPHTTVLPLIDPYYDAVKRLRDRKDGLKYIYPSCGASSGKTFYQLAPWNAVRNSKWLDIAKSIPNLKHKLMQNGVNLRFIIRVSDRFWNWKYKDWATMPQAQRDEIIKTEYSRFNEFLVGEERAGKSLFIPSTFDSAMQKEVSFITIEAVEDKTLDSKYLEDSQESALYILFALGLDGTLIGNTPGKGMGAGSGSDKRVAFNIFIANSKPEQDIILEPLEFIRDYNGWDPAIQFWFKNYWITTLDKGKETQQQTA